MRLPVLFLVFLTMIFVSGCQKRTRDLADISDTKGRAAQPLDPNKSLASK